MQKLPSNFLLNFIQVPLDFKDNFKNDIYIALRNIGGVSVAPSGKLFTSKTVYQQCIDSSLRHPFTKNSFVISVRTPQRIIDYFRPDVLFERQGKSFYGLKRHPGAPRFGHIDLSENFDRTGIAIVHNSGWIEDPNTMLRVPTIETDLLLAVEGPNPPDKISF